MSKRSGPTGAEQHQATMNSLAITLDYARSDAEQLDLFTVIFLLQMARLELDSHIQASHQPNQPHHCGA
jgi:hypothetical protein